MSHIGILVPTLGRPGSLRRAADNAHRATESLHDVVFVVEPGDTASYEAAEATGERVLVNLYDPSYSNSLQTAYEQTDHPFFIGANDDFDFQPGWDVEALKVMRSAPNIRVVGLHDGNPACDFSTISLIDRRYIVEQSGVADMPNRVNYPYKHNYVDTEFFYTAVSRKVFRPAPNAVVRHMHPDWGLSNMDATYAKSQSSKSEDGHTFNERAHLWAT